MLKTLEKIKSLFLTQDYEYQSIQQIFGDLLVVYFTWDITSCQIMKIISPKVVIYANS
jgi:hypothetical protein